MNLYNENPYALIIEVDHMYNLIHPFHYLSIILIKKLFISNTLILIVWVGIVLA
jgi:hypothetical protein